jgi:general secretion pathway protein B
MSYILDALKRAESERSRGAIPNIHAQPGPACDGNVSGPAADRRAALLVVVVVLLVAAVLWWWMSADSAPPATVVGEAPPPAIPSAPPAISPAIPPAAAPVVTASMPTPPMAVRPSAPPVVPVPNAPAKPIALPGLAQKAPLTPTSAASASERLYTLKELPDSIRSSLPVLTVGGATYSENSASRMLIVNGNLFHEGDKLTPEVTLQQIKLRAAVLSFRGYRYSISY